MSMGSLNVKSSVRGGVRAVSQLFIFKLCGLIEEVVDVSMELAESAESVVDWRCDEECEEDELVDELDALNDDESKRGGKGADLGVLVCVGCEQLLHDGCIERCHTLRW